MFIKKEVDKKLKATIKSKWLIYFEHSDNIINLFGSFNASKR